MYGVIQINTSGYKEIDALLLRLWTLVRSEFRWRRALLLSLPDLNCLFYSQLAPVWVLWLTRGTLAAIFTACLLSTCASNGLVPDPHSKKHHWTAYVTNWHLMLCTAYLIACCALMLVAKLNRGSRYSAKDEAFLTQENLTCSRDPLLPDNLATRTILRLLWLSMHICWTVSLLVTAFGLPRSFAEPTLGGLFSHGGGFLLLTVDAAVSGVPFQLVLAPYVQLCGLAYLVFTFCYWRMRPDLGPLYPALIDWDLPVPSALTSGLLILVCVPAAHCAWCLGVRAREIAGRRLQLELELLVRRRLQAASLESIYEI